jgi:hypothetical protein
MAIAPAQIVNYTKLGTDKFYQQVETYLQWGEFDWHMDSTDKVGVTLSARKTTNIRGTVRVTYRIDGKITAKAKLAKVLYALGAIFSV